MRIFCSGRECRLSKAIRSTYNWLCLVYITIGICVLMGLPVVNSNPVLASVSAGVFEVQVKVQNPENSPNANKTVLVMNDNSQVPTANFANGDEYSVTMENTTDLPVYVFYGASSSPGKHVPIIRPGNKHTVDSYKVGGAVFKVLTKKHDQQHGGQANFDDGKDTNRIYFLSPNIQEFKGEASDYKWKDIGSFLARGARGNDDTSRSRPPLAKTVPGRASIRQYNDTSYKALLTSYPVLAHAVLQDKVQITEFRWMTGDLENPADPKVYESGQQPAEYVEEAKRIFDGLLGAAQAIISGRKTIKIESASQIAAEVDTGSTKSVPASPQTIPLECFR